MKTVMLFLCACMSVISLPAQQHLAMSSPNGALVLENRGNDYALILNHEPLATLRMGIVVNGDTLSYEGTSVELVKRGPCSEKFNEYFLNQPSAVCGVHVRLYNDALAYRYEGENKDAVRITGELSSWQLPTDSRVWYFERKNAWKLKSYAGLWEQCDWGDLYKKAWSQVQGLPVVFKSTSGHYGFISEAALEHYSGLRLKADSQGTLSAHFTERRNGFEVPPYFHTPWRVLYLGKSLENMVNQKIIHDLSPRPAPSLYSDCSYIQPGKCAWRWFSKGTGNPEEERDIIDAAAALNFTYSLVDDGWKKWPDCWKSAKELVAYGKEKGVRLFFWQHSHALSDTIANYGKMRSFLDSISDIGAAGVKVDFMDSEAKSWIDFEVRMLKECARRKLLVNFHGCHNPGGEAYTYPNELTREGIRGLELNKMREGYIPAYHNASLPFTRFVVGHGDYTPLSFTVPGSTTWAHQLATLVCFDSPLQTVAEDPVLILNEPKLKSVVDFIRDVPTVWEETHVLAPSEIGKLAMMARRKGDRWYIGILNGEKRTKTVTVDLSRFMRRHSRVEAFLDDIHAPKIMLSMEGHRPALLKREPVIPFKKEKVTGELYSIQLAPEGGAVVVIHDGLKTMKEKLLK